MFSWNFVKRSITTSVLALPLAWAGPAGADEGTNVYSKEAPGLVLIRSSGDTEEVGSAFLISKDGYLLSAGHVVPEPSPGKSLIVTGAFGPDSSTAKPIPISVIARSPTFDVVLLHVDGALPSGVQALPIRHSAAHGGEQLFVLGFPLGLPDVHFLDGRVSAVDKTDITTNALINKGNSGGPIVDSLGCVIGIVYAGIEKNDHDDPVQGIKFAVPITAILNLLPKIETQIQAAVSANADDTIFVTDTLSRVQQHGSGLQERVESYNDTIPARPGYVIDSIERTDKNSLNPPKLPFPIPVVSQDGRTMSFTYSLVSGPIFDQRRGWIDMVIHTKQKRIGATSPVPAPARPCD